MKEPMTLFRALEILETSTDPAEIEAATMYLLWAKSLWNLPVTRKEDDAA